MENLHSRSVSEVKMEGFPSLHTPPPSSQPSVGAPLEPELCYLALEKQPKRLQFKAIMVQHISGGVTN